MQDPTSRLFHEELSTAVGALVISSDDNSIHAISFGTHDVLDGDPAGNRWLPAVMRAAISQLCDYFDGTLQQFNVPLAPSGTSFQLRVWEEMKKIEYGGVATYKEIAERLGNHNLARAVGGAANSNPIPVIIPCHRVVGSNGWIGGFAPGVASKKILLKLEGCLEPFT